MEGCSDGGGGCIEGGTAGIPDTLRLPAMALPPPPTPPVEEEGIGGGKVEEVVEGGGDTTESTDGEGEDTDDSVPEGGSGKSPTEANSANMSL